MAELPTPNEVAADLGIGPKALRVWLRAAYPRREDERYTRWYLRPDMVAAARAHFAR